LPGVIIVSLIANLIFNTVLVGDHATIVVLLMASIINAAVVLYWYWKYIKAANEYTNGKIRRSLVLVLLIINPMELI
jgi:integral membrane sensor domain MASE1